MEVSFTGKNLNHAFLFENVTYFFDSATLTKCYKFDNHRKKYTRAHIQNQS